MQILIHFYNFKNHLPFTPAEKLSGLILVKKSILVEPSGFITAYQKMCNIKDFAELVTAHMIVNISVSLPVQCRLIDIILYLFLNSVITAMQ